MAVRKLSLALNAALALVVLVNWLRMFVSGEGALSARGFYSLRYFTVLSNLLAAGASIAYAACLARMLRGTLAAVPRGVILAKYAGAASVALTLMTVVLFLGPTAKTGFLSMFEGANLWFHLLVPVLAVLDFCLWNPDGPLALADSLIACIPMALYALFYAINVARNGLERNGRTNDWYGFFRGGWPSAVAACVIIALGTWGMALLMRLARR